MQDPKRIVITGGGIPVRGNDIDTDRIIPARFLKTVVFEGLGEHAFEDDRGQLKDAGKTHPFDDAKYADARVLVVNKNFGCGSSREHAPQAIVRWGKGIAAIVGESFAEIFFGNCVSLGLPCVTVDEKTASALQAAIEAEPSLAVRVDLATKTVKAGEKSYPVTMADGPRTQLMEGRWDSTAELVGNREKIKQLAASIPYFNGFT